MNPMLFLRIAQLVAAISRVKGSQAFADLGEHGRELVDKVMALRQGLPRKANGSEWTDEEIADIAERASEGFVETLLREQRYL